MITHVHMLLRSFAIFWQKKINVVPHPPYSPDLAPYDFWLFPAVKRDLKGTKFEMDTDVVKAVEARCKVLSKDGPDFHVQKVGQEVVPVHCNQWELLWKKACSVDPE